MQWQGEEVDTHQPLRPWLDYDGGHPCPLSCSRWVTGFGTAGGCLTAVLLSAPPADAVQAGDQQPAAGFLRLLKVLRTASVAGTCYDTSCRSV